MDDYTFPTLAGHFRHIDGLLRVGDLDRLFEYGNDLISSGRLTGKALARLLYLMAEKWEELKQKSGVADEFLDVVEERMGVPNATASKYINMWAVLFAPDGSVPVEIQKRLLNSKPVEHLLLLPGVAADRPTLRQWEKIIATPDKASLRETIRDIRGIRTSANNALHLTLDREGRILARRGDKRARVVGLLKIDVESKQDDIIRDAVERIISNAGILVK